MKITVKGTKTIDKVVAMTKATHVGVNNPVCHGIPTSGKTLVKSYQLDIEDNNRILYIDIM